jgi:hypothetical protein
MDRTKHQVDPCLVDHGQGHVERVKDCLDILRKSLEVVSITKKELGRLHTEEEITQQDAAVYLHDVGRGLPDKGLSHAIASGEFIRKDNELLFDPEERERVARLVELHSDRATRELFGTHDLTELVRKGILSPEEAYLAGEIRIADALDVGRKRAERNTQGESIQNVIERIKRELPPAEAKARLSHIYGHMSIRDVRLRSKDNELIINFDFDEEKLTSYGADAAQIVNYTLRDINTTFLRGKYSVSFTTRNLERVKEWYDKYGYIIADELKEVKVYLRGSSQ